MDPIVLVKNKKSRKKREKSVVDNVVTKVPKKKKEKSVDDVVAKVPKKKKEKSVVDDVVAKVPKKRGRKPKPKSLIPVVKPPPKKRGRKPKPKPEGPVIKKILKRRGRKPKEMSYSNISNKNIIFDKETDNIIIHLPIKSSDVKNNIKEEELLTYNPTIGVPVGLESDNVTDNYQYLSQTSNTLENVLCGQGPDPTMNYASYPFDEKDKDIIEMLDNKDVLDSTNNEVIVNKNEVDDEFTVKHKDNWFSDHDKQFIEHNKGIDKIMEHIKSQRQGDIDNFSNKSAKKNIEPCLIQFNEANRNNTWPSHTSIYCWWCSHPFDGPPCALPSNYCNNVFQVKGVFCSPECAAAHNFNDTNSGEDLWERYALLNFLYRKIYNDNNIKIKLAPAKETLKIYGGCLTIKEFRIHNTNYMKTYKLISYPLQSITPIQELKDINNGFSSKVDNKIFLIEKDKLDNTLRLKRSTPYNKSKNTLERCMNLSTNKKLTGGVI